MEATIATADPDLTGIIASAVAGDDLAFGRIVAAHEAEMHRICVAVCRDQTIAADAVQAAWAIAWRKLNYCSMSVVITPDGAVWVGIEERGLLRFDGIEWEVVRPLGGDEDQGIVRLAANRDGVIWAEIGSDRGRSRLGEDRHLARFDGQDWEVFLMTPAPDFSYAPDSEYRGPSGIQAVGPDGTVWLTDTYPDPESRGGFFPVSFDGERWRRYPEIVEHWASDPVFELGECCIGAWHIATAADGATWVNVDPEVGKNSHGGVYIISPEATDATE